MSTSYGYGEIDNIGGSKLDGGNHSQYTNKLFGAPYQLLDSVDKRFDDVNPNLGNEYLRNFILNSPILRIKPGMPKFTGDDDSTSLSNLIKSIYGAIVTEQENISAGSAIFHEATKAVIFGQGKKLQNRMFGFRETYYEYIQYVNYMCRTVAIHMDLTSGDTGGAFYNDGTFTSFAKFDWQHYRMSGQMGNSDPLDQLGGLFGVAIDNIKGITGAIGNLIQFDIPGAINSVIETGGNSSVLGLIQSKINTVEFMVEPVAFTETLTNETANSEIENKLDSITEGMGSEIAWMTNSRVDSGIIDELAGILGSVGSTFMDTIGTISEPIGGGFTRSLFSGALASIKGQKMIYPKIYKKSNSSMDYTFTIKLTSPYGDKYNYYMNIVVPLMHLIALVAPRMVSSNTVASPFLVQAFIPGMCTCGLGIVSDMKITKNPSTKHVSVNGFPLTVEVSITIEELYNAMSISPANDPASFLFNETLNDYLCSTAGLMPGTDTYIANINANYQSINRYFDQGLFAQDIIRNPVQSIYNWFVR